MISKNVSVSLIAVLAILGVNWTRPALLYADEEREALLEELVQEQEKLIQDLENLVKVREEERDRYKKALELCEAERQREIDSCSKAHSTSSVSKSLLSWLGALIVLTGAAFGAGVYLGK